MSDTNYYFGHGQAWLGTRASDGTVSNYDLPLPEIDELTITLGTEKVEHISKRSSLASKDLSIVKMTSLTGKMVVSVHDPDMLEMYLFGTKSAVAGGSFLTQAFPSGVVLGDRLPIPGSRKHISALVIKDSAGSPVTLTLNTHYTIEDADAGIVKFGPNSISGFTQPFTASGTEGASTAVGILTQRVFEKALRFKGINIADSDKICVLDLYKIQIEPAKEWTLLNSGNEPNKYEIGFEGLKDTTKSVSATLGQYGDYREAGETVVA